jgi:hypothetical protein
VVGLTRLLVLTSTTATHPDRRRYLSHDKHNRLTLRHERDSALAGSLERQFEAAKLLRAELREHSLHLSCMLSEGRNNEVSASRGERDDPHAPVFGALDR